MFVCDLAPGEGKLSIRSTPHPAAALAQAAAALAQAAAWLTQAAAPPLAPAATPLAHPARHVLCYAARAAPITRC